MSNEVFVSFEQAKRLKKLVFNEPCFYHYDIKVNVINPIENILKINSPKTVISSNHLARTNIEFSDRYVFAPTLSQACKWLRSKGLFVQVCLNGIRNMYYNEIFETKFNGRSTGTSELFDTYEQAQSAGIDVALGLLEHESEKV